MSEKCVSSAGSASIGAYGDTQGIHNMLGSLWSSVMVEAPPLEEQLSILHASFPSLPPETLAGAIAALSLCQLAAGSTVPAALPPGRAAILDNSLASAGLKSGDLVAGFGRHFSLRDLFKLCKRWQVLPHPSTLSSISLIDTRGKGLGVDLPQRCFRISGRI